MSLGKAHLSLLSTGQPRKTHPDLTEKLLTGMNESNKNKNFIGVRKEVAHWLSVSFGIEWHG